MKIYRPPCFNRSLLVSYQPGGSSSDFVFGLVGQTWVHCGPRARVWHLWHATWCPVSLSFTHSHIPDGCFPSTCKVFISVPCPGFILVLKLLNILLSGCFSLSLSLPCSGRSRGGRGGDYDRRDRYGRRDFGGFRDRDNGRGGFDGSKSFGGANSVNGGYGGSNGNSNGFGGGGGAAAAYNGNGQSAFGGVGGGVQAGAFGGQSGFPAQQFAPGKNGAQQPMAAHPQFPFPQAPAPQQHPAPLVPYAMPPPQFSQ